MHELQDSAPPTPIAAPIPLSEPSPSPSPPPSPPPEVRPPAISAAPTPAGSQSRPLAVSPVATKSSTPARTPAREVITIDLTSDSDEEPVVIKTGKRRSDVLESPKRSPFFTVKKEQENITDVRQAKKAKIDIEGVIRRQGGMLQDLVNENK